MSLPRREGMRVLVGSASSSGSGGNRHPGRRFGAEEVMRWTLFQFVMVMMAFGTFLLTLLRFIFDHHDKKRK
jgi:hypothetical protein